MTEGNRRRPERSRRFGFSFARRPWRAESAQAARPLPAFPLPRRFLRRKFEDTCKGEGRSVRLRKLAANILSGFSRRYATGKEAETWLC